MRLRVTGIRRGRRQASVSLRSSRVATSLSLLHMALWMALLTLCLAVSTSQATSCADNPSGVFCSDDCSRSFRCIGDTSFLIENCASFGQHCYQFPDGRDAVCSAISQCGGPMQCQQAGHFPDPDVCTKYHECQVSSGLSVVHDCIGTAYNIASNVCDLPVNEPEVCGPEGPVPECTTRGQVGALARNPSYYFVCVQTSGILYPGMRKCSDELVYDPSLKKCVDASMVTTTTTAITTTGTTSTPTTTPGTTLTSTTTPETTLTPTTTPGTTLTPTTTPGTTLTPTTPEITTLTSTISSIGTLTSTSPPGTGTATSGTPWVPTPCPCDQGTPLPVDDATRKLLVSAVGRLHFEQL